MFDGHRGVSERLDVTRDSSVEDVVVAVRAWVAESVPSAWQDAGRSGGALAIRAIRSRADYDAWYPVLGRSGLVAPTWPVEYGGLDITPAAGRATEAQLQTYNLGRLNPHGHC